MTTQPDPEARPAPDLVDRNDLAEAPYQLAFGGRCREAGVWPSMGNAYDNAM